MKKLVILSIMVILTVLISPAMPIGGTFAEWITFIIAAFSIGYNGVMLIND